MLFFLWLVSLGFVAVAGNETELCVTHQIRNKATNVLVDNKIRCLHGCCGVYPRQTCCPFSIGLIVGGALGGIAALSLIAVLVCCCVKKHTSNQASVEPEPPTVYPYYHRPRTPHNTNINVLYAGGGPYVHFNPTFGWMYPVRRPATPISPPPYLDRDTPPPPYSRTHPSALNHRVSVPTLPGCLEDDNLLPPATLPLPHSHAHPRLSVSAVAPSSTEHHHSSGSDSDTDEHHSSTTADTHRSPDSGHTTELSDSDH